MTPEELDEARAEEAHRLWAAQPDATPGVGVIAARLARKGWTPPEPVDPDLLAAREWAKNNIHWIDAAYIARGAHDDAASIRAYLAGCTRGREGAKGLVEALEDAVAYIRGELGGTSQLYGLLKAADAALAFAKRGG